MNKTIIITGSSKGIGKAVAERFAKENYNIVITYNNSKKEAEQLRDDLSKITRVLLVKTDVSKKEDIDNLFDTAVKTFGKFDVLINNAGIAQYKLIIDEEYESIENLIRTNLTSIIYATKKAAEIMLKYNEGTIINISSIYAFSGGSNESVYSATKSALTGFTSAIAKELGPNGLYINAIAPGAIDTSMNDHFSKEDRKDFFESSAIQRMGTTNEIANVIFFLTSKESSYINGQTIRVDGGLI